MQVKIGDFGLACLDMLSSQYSSPTSDPNDSTDNRHTKGVGTTTYASPEQMSGAKYDTKVCNILFTNEFF